MKFKIKYLDLERQYKLIDKELNIKIKKIFKNSSFILRDEVKIFEKTICKLLNVKYLWLRQGPDPDGGFISLPLPMVLPVLPTNIVSPVNTTFSDFNQKHILSK